MKKQIIKILLGIALVYLCCGTRKICYDFTDFYASNATVTNRIAFKKDLEDRIIGTSLADELTQESEARWQSAFWGMELSLHRSDVGYQAIEKGLASYWHRSESFQRALLEAAYALYPGEFIQPIQQIAQKTNVPKHFAMAVHYLWRCHDTLTLSNYFDWLKQNFPDWQEQPILFMLANDLQVSRSQRLQTRPPLRDLFNHPFERDRTVIYSLQRLDRNFPGLTILKGPDGRFIRNPDGSLFHIAHLARAASNLPGYITNGNTPQGIFSIQGVDTSENVFIGPAPNLQLVLPFEATPATFHHADESDSVWSKSRYQALLPDSWKNYLPIYEAYYAGAAGRTEIIAHGTTIDPEFYRGQPYYPLTPSLGCLTATEIWSNHDGRCLHSDQVRFINAYLQTGAMAGYLVVVEIDAQPKPVILNDILMDVLAGEEKNASRLPE